MEEKTTKPATQAVGWKTVVGAFACIPVMIGTFIWMDDRQAAVASAPVPVQAQTPACHIDAPAFARADMQKMCDVGIFSRVTLRLEGQTTLLHLQVAAQEMAFFQAKRTEILKPFGRLVDTMVDDTRRNVAVTLHAPSGEMVGGCAREALAHTTVCR